MENNNNNNYYYYYYYNKMQIRNFIQRIGVRIKAVEHLQETMELLKLILWKELEY